MAKKKRKLTARERAEKKRRRQEWMTIFIHGKMKRIRRPPQNDGVDVVVEFIRQNADPMWLHQNEMWEYIEEEKATSNTGTRQSRPEDDEVPF
ncbi:MAG TPA: hypothetical protein VK208_00915 [Pyrinomonadaceae bacterium]|nr:hypothetical protein [Pyrinomonadaceae bacterium]